jgi:hypothetical protein
MYTTARRIAGVVRARLGVVAVQGTCTDTVPVHAVVAGCASVAVITAVLCVGVAAALSGVTTVFSAGISIVTGDIVPSDAGPGDTNLSGCAGIPIVAGTFGWSVDAPLFRIATVLCTDVLIIAIQRRAPLAQTVHAGVLLCARIAVITGPVHWGLNAALQWIAT